MTKATPDFIHKLVFLGDSSVGKTSLVQRYVYNSLDPNVGRTIGAMLHVKMEQYEDALHKLVILDSEDSSHSMSYESSTVHRLLEHSLSWILRAPTRWKALTPGLVTCTTPLERFLLL